MEPFITHKGIVASLDRVHVDTDQIIPKQFLKRIERTGFGEFLFFDWRYHPDGSSNPDFKLNAPRFDGASILLAQDNFGCGSSREHAPWALMDYGFIVLIAPSFADIFYSNCFKNGILPIRLPQKQVDELFSRCDATEGYELAVDLDAQQISDSNGLAISFEIEEHRKECLLLGLDDIAQTLQHEDKIAAYEAASA
jgi:3-isopropylmalate/(R)-2-methylmalate dehydratase small subunit